MPRYCVSYMHTRHYDINVEAEDELAAIAKADELVSSADPATLEKYDGGNGEISLSNIEDITHNT